MRRILFAIFGFFLLFPSFASGLEKGLTIKGVRFFSYPAFTRIVLELESAAPYTVNRTPDGRGVILAAYEGPLAVRTQLPAVRDGLVSAVESREDAGRQVIMLRLEALAGEVKDFVLRGPDRIVLDVAKAGQAAPGPAASVAPNPEKQVIVMLDPGHGGRDTGLVTAQGQEKTMNLELALAVRKHLQKDPTFKVLLSRDRDSALSLDERAAAANNAGAKVFVSIHAASAGAGSRVFIQDPNDDRRGERPLTRDFLGFEAGSEQQQNIWGRQQAGHARQSGVLGRMLMRQLTGNPDAEPVQAPLAQLKPVDAAAVVVETGVEQDRAAAAEAVARGIEAYVRENR